MRLSNSLYLLAIGALPLANAASYGNMTYAMNGTGMYNASCTSHMSQSATGAWTMPPAVPTSGTTSPPGSYVPSTGSAASNGMKLGMAAIGMIAGFLPHVF